MERNKLHRFGGKHTNRKVADLQTTNHNLSYSHWLEYSQGLIHIQFFQWSQILGFHCCTSTWLRLWKYQLYGVEGEEGRGGSSWERAPPAGTRRKASGLPGFSEARKRGRSTNGRGTGVFSGRLTASGKENSERKLYKTRPLLRRRLNGRLV